MNIMKKHTQPILALSIYFIFINILLISFFFGSSLHTDNRTTTTLPSTSNIYIIKWNKTWGGSNYDYGRGIALDASGNAFITGGTWSFGAGNSDEFLLKYDSSGNLLWYKTWGGSSSDEGEGIALDASGNAFITGYTRSYGAGGEDAFLLKYDSDGNLLWYKTWGGYVDEYGQGIAVDGSGNAFIAGTTYSYGLGNRAAFLLKYDSSGNLLWYKTWGGFDNDHGHGIALDGSGNAFITGSTGSFGEGNYDAFLLKYDSSGNQLWNKTWGGYNEDRGRGIAVDGSGNAFITGSTRSYGEGGEDAFLLKYDSDGNLLWYKTWGGYNEDRGRGIAVDGSGNAFITGYTYSYGEGNSDEFLLKYDTSGNLLWNITWGGSDYDSGKGIALDDSGNAFITGSTNSYGAGSSDAFLLRYELDTDGDGMSDGWEIKYGLNATWSGDASFDRDSDGLTNLEEYQYDTDPNNSDTDGDGQKDGDEIALGFDPNNPFSNSFIPIQIIIVSIVTISVISLVIVGKKINKKRKESFNDTLISEIEGKIKEGKELKVKGELEKVLNICNEQLLSSKKLYDSVNKEKIITKIKNLIDDTIVLTIEEKIGRGEQLNKEGDFVNAINNFKEQLENTKSISETSRREKITKKIQEYLIFSKMLKIKGIIVDLGSEFGRLQVSDIIEKCGEEEELIISAIQDMIKNREISAEYFKSSKAIAFKQQVDIEEIDKLMKSFDEWEKEGKGKKK
jgi:hypothetical protein